MPLNLNKYHTKTTLYKTINKPNYIVHVQDVVDNQIITKYT